METEVPAWSRENHCHSCHNNGDAARALYTAQRLGRPIMAGALAETSRWLAQPETWDHNGGDGPFSDRRLARVQFAAALAAGVASGAIADRGALGRAADRLVKDQAEDGSWRVGSADGAGSPATYGPVLGTVLARSTLLAADRHQYAVAIARAETWLWARKVKSVFDASALLIALDGENAPALRALTEQCLEVLTKGQSDDGGWGPYLNAPPEPFDTALALTALAPYRELAAVRTQLRRGRAYLLAAQAADGSWPETTRPPGASSYAQRVSTTGWATLALLRTSLRSGR
jgi:hypothetical protein